jgi:hypothetical protein
MQLEFCRVLLFFFINSVFPLQHITVILIPTIPVSQYFMLHMIMFVIAFFLFSTTYRLLHFLFFVLCFCFLISSFPYIHMQLKQYTCVFISNISSLHSALLC